MELKFVEKEKVGIGKTLKSKKSNCPRGCNVMNRQDGKGIMQAGGSGEERNIMKNQKKKTKTLKTQTKQNKKPFLMTFPITWNKIGNAYESLHDLA